MTLSITILHIQCHYAKCRDLFIVMLNVIMLSVVMLNVVARLIQTGFSEMENLKEATIVIVVVISIVEALQRSAQRRSA
jgi:hypothetical protein